MATKARGTGGGGDGRGIRWFVRLLLDTSAARRMEQEARRALEKGTDPRKAVQNLQAVEEKEGALERGFKRLGAVLVAVFAVDKLKEFAKEMFEVGSSAAETASKFTTTFGSASDRMQKFLDQWATLAGLDRTTGRDFAATIAAIGQGMGMAKTESADFAERVLRLAGDLQSFHDVPIEETFAAIQSGLAGEVEPMRRFGVMLTAVKVQQEALRETGKRHTDDLTDQEKALASLTLMYQGAGVAIGDLERTQDSAANKERSLEATFRDIRIEIAEKLLPTFASLIHYLGDHEEGIKHAADQAGESLAALLEALGRLATFAGHVYTITVEIKQKGEGLDKWISDQFGKIGLLRRMGDRRWASLSPDQQAAYVARMKPLLDSYGGYDPYVDQYERAQANFANRPGQIEGVAGGDLASATQAEADAAEAAAKKAAAAAQARADAAKAAADKEAERQKALAEQRLQRAIDAMDARHADASLSGIAAIGQTMVGAQPMPDLRASVVEPLHLNAVEGAFHDLWTHVTESSETAAGVIADAFGGAFNRVMQDGATVGHFFTGLGKALAGALLGGLAAYAKGKIKENVAAAIEAAAYALGFVSTGQFASAGAAWASAAEHTAAAVAWGAAGGLASASSAQLTGVRGAGGFGPSVYNDAGAGVAARSEPQPINILLQGDFDALNPKVVKVVYGAYNNALETHGTPKQLSAIVQREAA